MVKKFDIKIYPFVSEFSKLQWQEPNEITKLAVKNNAIKDPYIGIEFNGRYVVKSLLGSGTYGRVYLVEDKGIQIEWVFTIRC